MRFFFESPLSKDWTRTLKRMSTLWSDVKTPRASRAFSAMLALAGPIMAGALAGHPRVGILASVGGLAVAGTLGGETVRQQARDLFYALGAGSAATFIGSGISGHGSLTAISAVIVCSAVSVFVSFSRPMARAAILFMFCILISANLGNKPVHPLVNASLFFLGAAWTLCVFLAVRPLFRAIGLDRPAGNRTMIALPPKYTAAQLLRRWRRSLKHMPGWQYAIRITLCLAAGLGFEWLWPCHHGYWVLITVVIVVQYDLQAGLQRTIHRAAGTVVGILLTGLLFLGSSSIWTAIAMVAVLAAARPLLMELNYAAYAAVQTPLDYPAPGLRAEFVRVSCNRPAGGDSRGLHSFIDAWICGLVADTLGE